MILKTSRKVRSELWTGLFEMSQQREVGQQNRIIPYRSKVRNLLTNSKLICTFFLIV